MVADDIVGFVTFVAAAVAAAAVVGTVVGIDVGSAGVDYNKTVLVTIAAAAAAAVEVVLGDDFGQYWSGPSVLDDHQEA